MLMSESHPFCLEYHVGKNEVAKAGTFVEVTFRAIWTYKSMQTFFWLVTQPSFPSVHALKELLDCSQSLIFP